MAVDAVTPLATVAQFTEGPFANLTNGFTLAAQQNIMIYATRACEAACDRRLAPFTGLVETQRASSLDVEDALDAYIPLDPVSALQFSRAQSLGSTTLVRHFWVREFPPRFPEFWSASISGVTLYRSYSGGQTVNPATIQFEQDTGHARFQLGTFTPPGTTIQVTYSGGYSTIPGDLIEACKFMAASIALKELDPADGHTSHNPDELRAEALEMLGPYGRR